MSFIQFWDTLFCRMKYIFNISNDHSVDTGDDDNIIDLLLYSYDSVGVVVIIATPYITIIIPAVNRFDYPIPDASLVWLFCCIIVVTQYLNGLFSFDKFLTFYILTLLCCRLCGCTIRLFCLCYTTCLLSSLVHCPLFHNNSLLPYQLFIYVFYHLYYFLVNEFFLSINYYYVLRLFFHLIKLNIIIWILLFLYNL